MFDILKELAFWWGEYRKSALASQDKNHNNIFSGDRCGMPDENRKSYRLADRDSQYNKQSRAVVII
jgi:hypothetical protein